MPPRSRTSPGPLMHEDRWANLEVIASLGCLASPCQRKVGATELEVIASLGCFASDK